MDPASPAAAPEGLSRRTMKGMLWMGSGKGAQAILQVVVLVILARLLSPAEFGVVAAAMVVIVFSKHFFSLGVGPAIVQRPELEERHIRSGFTLSVCFGVLLGALIWTGAPLIAMLLRIEEVTPVLRGIAVAFPFMGLAVVAEALLQRDLRFGVLVRTELVGYGVAFGVVGIGMALMGFGVWALVAAQACKVGLTGVLMLMARPHSKRPLLEPRALRELVYFGGGFTLARLSNLLAMQLDNVIVARWLGPAALGLYGRAYQLMNTNAQVLGMVFDRVLFPAIARVQDDRVRVAAVFARATSVIAVLTLSMGAAFVVLAPELIHVLLGPGWGEVVLPFQILAVGVVFRTSCRVNDALARACGAVYQTAWREGVYAGLVVVGALIGQRWGIGGVAAGVVAAGAVEFLLLSHLSLSLVPLRWTRFVGAHVPGLLLGGITASTLAASAGALRALDAPPALVLAGSVTALAVVTAAILRVRGSFFLGPDVMRLADRVAMRLPQRFRWIGRMLPRGA